MRERQGRDEINLTEFPLGLPSDRPAKRTASLLRFEAGDKVWEIAGHPQHGLPTARDVEVYVCLMELTREQGYPDRVRFNRHDLLQRLGWNRSADKYARLKLAMDRLVGVTITTTNAYYDARNRRWLQHHAFHVLEEYQIIDRRDGGAGEPASWFRWSEAIARNLQAGYLKPLNVSLFLSLRSSISQTLYRYLDAKIRDGKTVFRRGLRDLAYQHLGLSRDYYPSQIKRELNPAHQELIAAGFLTRAEYSRTQSGEEMVTYYFPHRHPAAMLPAARSGRAADAGSARAGGPDDAGSGAGPRQSAAPPPDEATAAPPPEGGVLGGASPAGESPGARGATAASGRRSRGVRDPDPATGSGADPVGPGRGGRGRSPRLPAGAAPVTEPGDGARDRGTIDHPFGAGPPDGGAPVREDEAGLLERLIEAGLARGVAARLVRLRPEECERQLAYLPYREELRHPGGALRRAIEEEWPAPPRWRLRAEAGRPARLGKEGKTPPAEALPVEGARSRRPAPSRAGALLPGEAPAERGAEAQAAVEAAAFDAWWATLPESEREPLTAQARAELIGNSAILAQYYQRHPHRLPEALRPRLQQLSSWSSPEPAEPAERASGEKKKRGGRAV